MVYAPCFPAFLTILPSLFLSLQVSFPYQAVTEKFKTDSNVDLKNRLIITLSTRRLLKKRTKCNLWLHFLATISVLTLPFNWSSIIKPRYLCWLTLSTFSSSIFNRSGTCLFLVLKSNIISLVFFTLSSKKINLLQSTRITEQAIEIPATFKRGFSNRGTPGAYIFVKTIGSCGHMLLKTAVGLSRVGVCY